MINKNIKWLRVVFGITLKDLSDYLGINVSTLSSYEERGVNPKYETVSKLWRFYQSAFDELTLEEFGESDLEKLNKDFDRGYFAEKFNSKSTAYKSKFKTEQKSTLVSTDPTIDKLLQLYEKLLDSEKIKDSNRLEALLEKIIDKM